MNRAYLSVASNIRPRKNILKAIARLRDASRVLTVSRCFVTDAIPAEDQHATKDLPQFINCVVLVETAYGAREVKCDVLRPLETALGRVRTEDKYAPRPIDLDILWFDSEIRIDDDLVNPDPEIFTRWFLARGILDIDGGVVLPNPTEPFRVSLASRPGMHAPSDHAVPEDRQLREDILAMVGSAPTSEPVALVTGASPRVGAHIVSTLHARGMRVVVHHRHSDDQARALCDTLERTRPGSVMLVAADLTSPDAPQAIIDAVRSRWGRLDVLVNNAAVFYPTPLEHSTVADWDALTGANLRAPYFLAQAALPLLQAQGGGIINMVDVYAERPRPGYAINCATKAGLVVLTRALARELAPRCVTCLMPPT
jgi:2-amino-4-hydroxy-6-hydroxymethyldihydropteridine diphosphokinase